jgi:hypothetical protein
MFKKLLTRFSSPVHGQVEDNTYELWLEGNASNFVRAQMVSVIKGPTFVEAVKNYLDKQHHPQVTMWHYNEESNYWQFHNRRVFDNEKDAKVRFG